MKKTLPLILIFLFGFGQFIIQAQPKTPDGFVRYERQVIHPDQGMTDFSNAVVGAKNYDQTIIGTTWYDAQTINYGNIMPRTWLFDDGSIGASWTSSGQNLVPERGIGYNYYNGTEWGTADPHVGPEDRHGTVCYAPWGANGEIACTYQYIAGESPILFFRRDVKGEGDWIQTQADGPEGVSLVWHSMNTSGENHEFIHLLAYTYDQEVQGQENALLYYRSADGGETWDPNGVIIEGLGSDYILSINALSYTWANPVGNTIAFTYGFDQWGGWVFKSNDNGDTWEQITVMESEFDPFDPPVDSDIFGMGIGSSAIALDSDGKAHVVFARMMQGWTDDAWGYYPLNSDGLIYWNEDLDPLDTTIISSTGLENLEAGGYLCGYVFGYDPSVGVEIPDGQPNYANAICGYPAISIDADDNIFISSSNIAPDFPAGDLLYRHIFANSSFDGGQTWNGAFDINADIQFIFSECAFPAMVPVVDNTIYFLFQEDQFPGTFNWPEEQVEAVENRMYMLEIPKSTFVGLEENEGLLNFELSEVYPNPAYSDIALNLRLENNSNVNMQVVNMVGQSIISRDMGSMNAGDHRISFNVSELNAGIYHCIISVDGQRLSRKIVVQ